jgi:DSBA-like thioredoxin domain.
MQVTCYYDYTCPYSYKAFLWLEALRAAGAAIEVTWRTFSLKEANRDPARPSVLEGPEAGSASVLALALAHAAGAADFDRYHREVFAALHVEHRRLVEVDLLRLAADAGVDVADFNAHQVHWLSALAADHREGTARYRVFGTPTLVLDGEAVVFLKLADPPAEGEATRLWQSLCTLARCHPELLEIKRPA